MTLVDLMYTSSLTPGLVVVDTFHADRRPKHVRLIERVEELTEGLYRITFSDGTQTRSLGDERWLRA